MRISILLLVIASSAWSQSTKLGERCDLARVGGQDTKEFLRFHEEFRRAIADRDAGAMAMLVENPLRINDDQGTYYIKDAKSLQGRFQELFPAALRKLILDAKPEALLCTSGGVMYGDGEVWIGLSDHGYAVHAINLPSYGRTASAIASRVEFVCRTAKHRILIDSVAAGSSRYRVWNLPRSILDKPDLEIPKGNGNMEGTGPCVHAVWLFESGSTKYQVNDLGCYSDSDQPPAGATGQLTVTVGGKQSSAWCY